MADELSTEQNRVKTRAQYVGLMLVAGIALAAGSVIVRLPFVASEGNVEVFGYKIQTDATWIVLTVLTIGHLVVAQYLFMACRDLRRGFDDAECEAAYKAVTDSANPLLSNLYPTPAKPGQAVVPIPLDDFARTIVATGGAIATLVAIPRWRMPDGYTSLELGPRPLAWLAVGGVLLLLNWGLIGSGWIFSLSDLKQSKQAAWFLNNARSVVPIFLPKE